MAPPSMVTSCPKEGGPIRDGFLTTCSWQLLDIRMALLSMRSVAMVSRSRRCKLWTKSFTFCSSDHCKHRWFCLFGAILTTPGLLPLLSTKRASASNNRGRRDTRDSMDSDFARSGAVSASRLPILYCLSEQQLIHLTNKHECLGTYKIMVPSLSNSG